MKKYTIRRAKRIGIVMKDLDYSKGVDCSGTDDMEVSDGYHTMDELYEHRITLYIYFCQNVNYINSIWKQGGVKMTGDRTVWRSKSHSDGSIMEGWFILGIGTEKGKQITYHLPVSKWEETSFAKTLDTAPEWDGHTSADVLDRLKNL